MSGDPEPLGYEAYGAFVKDELEAQDRRKASFEQRGLAVITTSGTLVTLLFALAALSTKKTSTFALPDGARSWLMASLAFFFVSAIAALLTNLPLSYEAAKPDAIRERLRHEPPHSADAATKDIALTRIKALRSAKQRNAFKGWALLLAMACQAVGVGCVAAAVRIIL